MNIGILKEDPAHERRVPLTPAGVQSLVSGKSQVFIEKDAGKAAHFSNEEYEAVGGKIVYTSDEIFGRSDVILKISPPSVQDCQRMIESQVLFSALHLAVAKNETVNVLLQKKICAIGYELMEDQHGDMPILQIMSEMAGQMSIQVAARYLESNSNGRGIVMGGITGVPHATIVIIGAGTVGRTAARIALSLGAEVFVLDKDFSRLRTLANQFNYRITTAISNEYNIRKVLRFADVVIGAVLIKAERAPHVVSEDMIKQMKPGSIVIDVSIDQGGCIETSRPTTLENPTYVLHNVIHYCVPNIAANVARTGTYGFTNALVPYLLEIIQKGTFRTLRENVGLTRGVCTYNGYCTNDVIARRFGLPYHDIQKILTDSKIVL